MNEIRTLKPVTQRELDDICKRLAFVSGAVDRTYNSRVGAQTVDFPPLKFNPGYFRLNAELNAFEWVSEAPKAEVLHVELTVADPREDGSL